MSKLITVTGVVQGVGFRPYIYRQAMKLSLTGWVRNDGEGVTIYLTQDLTDNQVRTELLVDPPPGARIDAIACVATPVQPVTGFTVIPSDSSGPKR
ncbi:acylphosphatase, partial [Ferrimicrobium acidiphilum]